MNVSYLNFEEVPNPEKKTKRWSVGSKQGGTYLGYIYYHAPWRKYVVSFEGGTIFDAKCLTELSEFLVANKDVRND